MRSEWITVVEAAKEAGLSRWQMRRRLVSLNEKAGGRLLRSNGTGERVGKWEVNVVVLRDLLTIDPMQRERELAEVHERVTVLDNRTAAIRRKLTRNTKQLEKHAKAIEALTRAKKALLEVGEAMFS